jgi:hypothetical protein
MPYQIILLFMKKYYSQILAIVYPYKLITCMIMVNMVLVKDKFNLSALMPIFNA